MCIGIGIEATITSCVFPVTTADLELDQLLRALGCLASLGQRVAASQAGAGGACGGPSPAAQAAAEDSGGALPEGESDKEVSEQAGLAATAEAAEAGLVAPQPAAAAVAPLLAQAPATPAEQHAQLQALAGKAKKHAGKLMALSTESVQGPMPAFARTQRRHQPTAATVAALLHIVDSLLLATYSEELREARRAAAGSGGASPKDAAGLPHASRHLALAVGAQVRMLRGHLPCMLRAWQVCVPAGHSDGPALPPPAHLAPQFAETVHCLHLVLTRQLAVAEALPAMQALDRQLHQLAAAAGLELQPLLRPAGAALVQLPGGGGGSAKLGDPAPTISSAATLLPLAAAMLSAVPQVGGAGSVLLAQAGVACAAGMHGCFPCSSALRAPPPKPTHPPPRCAAAAHAVPQRSAGGPARGSRGRRGCGGACGAGHRQLARDGGRAAGGAGGQPAVRSQLTGRRCRQAWKQRAKVHFCVAASAASSARDDIYMQCTIPAL